MKDVLVEETMEDYDSNGDGFIESEEYNGMGHHGMFDEVRLILIESDIFVGVVLVRLETHNSAT